MKLQIAIDGPSGAGKSTVAKAVAKHFGLIYVDTGALYRSVGLYVRRHDKNPKDESEVAPLLDKIKLELKYTDAGQRVIMCGEDVSDAIRTPEMSMYASAVSALPAVRAFLLELQREIAAKGNVIMDGRDIGTVIMPDATVKIFMSATPEARAGRRLRELREKGEECTYEDVLADIIKRDRDDSTRMLAPAVAADDALMLDNSDMDFDTNVECVINIIRERIKDK